MTAEQLRRTPLFDVHRRLKARLVPFAGWEMPVQYVGIVEEHRAVRESAGLFDVSHMGELWLRGPGALPVLDSLITNDARALPVGRALYTLACNAAGGVLDDLLVYHVAPEEWLVVCNAGNHAKMSAHFAEHAAGRAELEDASEATALLALQGPKAQATLAAAGGSASLLELDRLAVARGRLGTIPVLGARTGYTGEDGFELFLAPEAAPAAFQGLLAAGAAPVGLGARDTLRLEAALRLYGNDLDESIDPYEAGLAWPVKLAGRRFLGSEALERKQREGATRKLVGLEMVERGIARHGYPVHDSAGRTVGQVTSGSPSPTLGRNIGLALIDSAHTALGSALYVEIRGKNVQARVVALPFYKRKAS